MNGNFSSNFGHFFVNKVFEDCSLSALRIKAKEKCIKTALELQNKKSVINIRKKSSRQSNKIVEAEFNQIN